MLEPDMIIIKLQNQIRGLENQIIDLKRELEKERMKNKKKDKK